MFLSIGCSNFINSQDVERELISDTNTPTHGSWVINTPDPKLFPVIIKEVHHTENFEIITITNIDNEDHSLAGIAILDPDTLEIIYLPEITLKANETYNVCNGKCNETFMQLKGSDFMFLNEVGDHISLLNSAGRVIWNYVYLSSYNP